MNSKHDFISSFKQRQRDENIIFRSISPISPISPISVETTKVPIRGNFPETWQIKFFSDLSLKEKQIYCRDLAEKIASKEYCDVFKDSSTEDICIRLTNLLNKNEYFMIAYDNATIISDGVEKPIGIIGFIWYDLDFNYDEIYVNMAESEPIAYFVVGTVWSCTFTTNENCRDHFSEKKSQGYEISVAKYLKIAVLEIIMGLLEIKDNGAYVRNIRVDYIMTFGCSLNTAIDSHQKNGAKIMSAELIENFIPIKERPKKYGNYLKYLCNQGDQMPIYWAVKVGDDIVERC